MIKKEVIFVFGAHTDDFVIGAGGTIANYIEEGKKVVSIIFSLGELSHPWVKENVIKGVREKETLEASKLIGCETYFLNLGDQKIERDYKQTGTEQKLLDILEKEKPTKIFTHSVEDPHPDHRKVHHITLNLYEKVKFRPKPEIYVYSVWNPVSFKTNWPVLYVDIGKTFNKKLAALKKFQSQKIPVAYPLFLLLFRAIKNGFKVKGKFGEKFFRVK